MAGRPAVLVLGIGNPLRGDDGIGPRVVEELAQRGLPEGVTALDVGMGGLDLLRVLEGWERAVIVDAAEVGREPGQIVRFTPDHVRLALATDGLSLHHVGLGEVMALADALGQVLPEMVIFGIQPAELDWRQGLSPAVEAALPTLVDAVIEAIEEIKGENHAQDSGDRRRR
jgi:hydrogenase maturation protease